MSQVKVEVEVGACKLDHDGSSFLDYSYEVMCVSVLIKVEVIRYRFCLLSCYRFD